MATTILKLPDELHLDIARHVDITGLLGLSLTCRRLRPIAQEALVRQGSVSPANIWKLVETLRIHSNLAKALTHLRLKPMSQDVCDAMMVYNDSRRATMTNEEHNIYSDIIYGAHPSEKIGGDFPSDDFTSDGLAVLFTLVTTLKAVFLSTNTLPCVAVTASILFGNEPLAPNHMLMHEVPRATRLQILIRSLLQERLEALELVPDCDPVRVNGILRLRPAILVSLSGFQHLKRLVVPVHIVFSLPSKFSYDEDSSTSPCQILPRSLEHLCLDFQTTTCTYYMDWLDAIVEGQRTFTRLRQVELRHHRNVWSTAWAVRGPRSAMHLNTARRLKDSSTIIKTTFGEGKMTELEQGRGAVLSAEYIAGDLVQAIERCLNTTHDELELDPELLGALGYASRFGYCIYGT